MFPNSLQNFHFRHFISVFTHLFSVNFREFSAKIPSKLRQNQGKTM